MAAVNQVGNALTGLTGTGTFVGATSPTLVTPVIAQINDANGNAILSLTAVPSAVNNTGVFNNVTTGGVGVYSVGSDTNIPFTVASKGTGQIGINTLATSAQVAFATGTANQKITNFSFANTSGTNTVTFPDASGTVQLQGQSLGAATATSISFGGGTLSVYSGLTSWTPVFTFDTPGDLSVAYTLQLGNYTRIGNVVNLNWFLSFAPTFTTSSGSVRITGLPFQVNANGFGFGATTISGGIGLLPAGATFTTCQAVPSVSYMTMVASGTNLGPTNLNTTNFISTTSYTMGGSVTYSV